MPTLFRPCIDLHQGRVKQIVGGTLTDGGAGLRTNFVASHGAAYYAQLYQRDNLLDGHVIQLGPGNAAAAKEALSAWPGGLQLGGSVTLENAQEWLDCGASKIIVTSWLFPGGEFSEQRLSNLKDCVGAKRIVVDLSCRRVGKSWHVATNKWQTITTTELSRATLNNLASYCSEFLVHAADVEGLCKGIDQDLVKALGQWSPIPCTYAGGAQDISDLMLVEHLSAGHVDLTIGSALDIFGGDKVKYADCVQWNKAHCRSPSP